MPSPEKAQPVRLNVPAVTDPLSPVSLDLPVGNPLTLYIRGLTEEVFIDKLGIASTALTDYVSDVLVRFSNFDNMWTIRDENGVVIRDIPLLLAQADRIVEPAKDAFTIARHVGDVALFSVGILPELLNPKNGTRDGWVNVDVMHSGKLAYDLASARAVPPFDAEQPVLRAISSNFETCCYGLGLVRKQLVQFP